MTALGYYRCFTHYLVIMPCSYRICCCMLYTAIAKTPVDSRELKASRLIERQMTGWRQLLTLCH